MNRHHVLLSLTLFAGFPATAALALPGAVAVPPDSFIKQHVDNVPQLTQQVTLDPVVRRRLARHFHTSGPAVVSYIQKNLVLKRLTSAKTYQVWCITPGGREYTINSRLAAGTPVFMMRGTNRPVLKLACANPMVAVLPSPPEELAAPKIASVPTEQLAPVVPVPDTNPVVMASVPGPGVDVTPTTLVSPALPSLLPHGGGGRFPLGFLAGLPILYGIVGHGGGSNGNTGTTGPGTTGPGTGPGTTGPGTGPGTTGPGTGPGTTGPGTGPGTTGPGTGPGTTGPGTGPGVTPVPEPSPYAAFAVGAFGLAMLIGKSRRRVRSRKN